MATIVDKGGKSDRNYRRDNKAESRYIAQTDRFPDIDEIPASLGAANEGKVGARFGVPTG